MSGKVKEYELLPLFHSFIYEIKSGKHLQKNGRRIKPESIKNYEYLELLLIRFCEQNDEKLRLRNAGNLTLEEFHEEKLYWKRFYHAFTDYLYDDLDHYDNYVGRMIKLLRSFFNYLLNEKGLSIGFFHKNFYSPSEDVDIVVLNPERINYLVYNKEIEKELNPDLKRVKDVFVFGCAVALRYSDLMALKKSNLECINERYYIKVLSKKTQTYSRVKLPGFAIELLKTYASNETERLFPLFNKVYMNKKIKKVMELYGFTEIIERKRSKRGVPISILNNNEPLRFCDAVTTHTMRRSAITTLLSLGMKEQMVRQISGHAAGSKEFYRYVAYAQTYIDKEIDMVHKKLNSKTLISA